MFYRTCIDIYRRQRNAAKLGANLLFSFFLHSGMTEGSATVLSGSGCTIVYAKVKVGVLRPVQQPGSYWDRSSELPLVGLEPTEVTAYD